MLTGEEYRKKRNALLKQLEELKRPLETITIGIGYKGTNEYLELQFNAPYPLDITEMDRLLTEWHKAWIAGRRTLDTPARKQKGGIRV